MKILYQEKDPKIEAVADDLASLVLDARMEQEGYPQFHQPVPVSG
ncbi:formate dehydrogenase accessory protein FdhE [Escherichia coli]